MRPVFWSVEAQRDNLEILTYLAADNPGAADRVVDAIAEAGTALGRFATGKPGRVLGTYEKPLARYPYVIAYAVQLVDGIESIVIVRVIHMARDWPSEDWPE
ncbi:Plasmid stabilization system protein ParE [Devosia lucknowensis]|uniref:Plasmid stabilization system protein ParE n=1 Tax=Devosia lucknowensis TaxID=1096929 RepID=A0A1Y6G6L7_9HYPH|nr:type II toxin-antitoxin system RelE/ParE family toxin [Devosia lucknowensis]SMQ85736.1 Plasmid stabilization system protein ParE [Devosia lucknowensis]